MFLAAERLALLIRELQTIRFVFGDIPRGLA
jgi:hypothetical protein